MCLWEPFSSFPHWASFTEASVSWPKARAGLAGDGEGWLLDHTKVLSIHLWEREEDRQHLGDWKYRQSLTYDGSHLW
jgi:hypothetical protein